MESNTTEDEYYDDYTTYPEYQAGVLIWKVVPPILILLGTIGNILSIVVLTRKSIKTSTTALYFTFLAASDLCVLYTGLLRHWIRYVFEYDLRQLSEAVCKIHIWLVYSSLDFSAWIIIAFTLERVISVWCPISAKTKCSRKYATALLITILLFLLALNSHMLYGKINKDTLDEQTYGFEYCVAINDNYYDFFYQVWPWIDLCMFCLIPISVIIVGNCCILFRIFRSHRKTRARSESTVSMNQRTSLQHRRAKHSSMTAMLFTLNIVFLFTTSPISIYNIGYPHWVISGSNQDYANLELWWAIVTMLQYTNNSINFLLYCLSGTRFRKEVRRIICPKPRPARNISMDNCTNSSFNLNSSSYSGPRGYRHNSSKSVQYSSHSRHSPDKSSSVPSYSMYPSSSVNPCDSTKDFSLTTLSACPVIPSEETSRL